MLAALGLDGLYVMSTPWQLPQHPSASRDLLASCLGQATSTASSAQPPGRCPLRKFKPLGGLIALKSKGQLQCPAAIIKLRAAVARLKPIRELRPKGLPVKMVAISAMAAGSNLPFGAVREHFDKFSLGWFVAVHATIPFIAVLRKAVVMPRWAIALTISGAIIGQAIGARVERHRLALIAEEQGLGMAWRTAAPLQSVHSSDSSMRSASSGSGIISSKMAGFRGSERGRSAQAFGPGGFGPLSCGSHWQGLSSPATFVHRSARMAAA
ncbi:hypothetical protein WJX72_002560 [[Myrmecia] bisecta]|uniref:Uncharacterized protein n=1 Tax=[Myrmecia] bisecta TaxID=41462 RepID=A0AAW1PW76_9CHLO